MAEFLTPEWWDAVTKLAKPLPKVVGVDLKVGFEINKTPQKSELAGKVVRCSLEIASGQLKNFEYKKSDKTEVTIRGDYENVLAVLNGELMPEVALMQGAVKLDGDYEKILFGLMEFWNSKPWTSFWKKVPSSL